MFGKARLSSALRFQNRAILLNNLEVLCFPEHLVKEPPVSALQPSQIPIPQEVHQRSVFIDRRGETEDTQYSFRPKRKRDIETDPQRLAAVELRPVEIHAALSLTLD